MPDQPSKESLERAQVEKAVEEIERAVLGMEGNHVFIAEPVRKILIHFHRARTKKSVGYRVMAGASKNLAEQNAALVEALQHIWFRLGHEGNYSIIRGDGTQRTNCPPTCLKCFVDRTLAPYAPADAPEKEKG